MNDVPEQPSKQSFELPPAKPKRVMRHVLIRRRDRGNNLVHGVAITAYMRNYQRDYEIVGRIDGPAR